jgi:hypothetical protein
MGLACMGLLSCAPGPRIDRLASFRSAIDSVPEAWKEEPVVILADTVRVTLKPGAQGDHAPCTYSRNTFRIDPSFPEADQRMDQEPGGYLAFCVLMQEKKSDVKDVYRQTLTRLGTSNALKTCRVEDLNARGKLVFANPTQSVERKGETRLKLSHVFSPFFPSYDTSRATGFKNGLDGEFAERVEIARPPGKKLEAGIPCEAASNALFKVDCRTEENDSGLVFTRSVLLRKAKLDPAQMRDLYPQVAALNRIEDARVIVRGESAGRTEAAAGKRAPRR